MSLWDEFQARLGMQRNQREEALRREVLLAAIEASGGADVVQRALDMPTGRIVNGGAIREEARRIGYTSPAGRPFADRLRDETSRYFYGTPLPEPTPVRREPLPSPDLYNFAFAERPPSLSPPIETPLVAPPPPPELIPVAPAQRDPNGMRDLLASRGFDLSALEATMQNVLSQPASGTMPTISSQPAMRRVSSPERLAPIVVADGRRDIERDSERPLDGPALKKPVIISKDEFLSYINAGQRPTKIGTPEFDAAYNAYKDEATARAAVAPVQAPAVVPGPQVMGDRRIADDISMAAFMANEPAPVAAAPMIPEGDYSVPDILPASVAAIVGSHALPDDIAMGLRDAIRQGAATPEQVEAVYSPGGRGGFIQFANADGTPGEVVFVPEDTPPAIIPPMVEPTAAVSTDVRVPITNDPAVVWALQAVGLDQFGRVQTQGRFGEPMTEAIDPSNIRPDQRAVLQMAGALPYDDEQAQAAVQVARMEQMAPPDPVRPQIREVQTPDGTMFVDANQFMGQVVPGTARPASPPRPPELVTLGSGADAIKVPRPQFDVLGRLGVTAPGDIQKVVESVGDTMSASSEGGGWLGRGGVAGLVRGLGDRATRGRIALAAMTDPTVLQRIEAELGRRDVPTDAPERVALAEIRRAIASAGVASGYAPPEPMSFDQMARESFQ